MPWSFTRLVCLGALLFDCFQGLYHVYASFHRALRPAPFIFAGLCELVNLYLVAATAPFIDVPLASLVAEAAPQVILS